MLFISLARNALTNTYESILLENSIIISNIAYSGDNLR